MFYPFYVWGIMEIQKANGSWEEIKINDFKHSILIDYELEESTSRKLISFDRGSNSDRYGTKLFFRKDTATVKDLFTIFDDLRESNIPISLRGFEERVFGDHLDYSGTITCILDTDSMDIQESPAFNVLTFSVILVAVEYNIVLGTPSLPNLNCLQVNWTGGHRSDINTQMTYGGSFYSTDSSSDMVEFKGSYLLDIEANERLYKYWVKQRGISFNTTSTAFGAVDMFGEKYGENHNVVIKSIEYKRASPILRQVTIVLRRQGD